jgi:hypothetical protein
MKAKGQKASSMFFAVFNLSREVYLGGLHNAFRHETDRADFLSRFREDDDVLAGVLPRLDVVHPCDVVIS